MPRTKQEKGLNDEAATGLQHSFWQVWTTYYRQSNVISCTKDASEKSVYRDSEIHLEDKNLIEYAKLTQIQ